MNNTFMNILSIIFVVGLIIYTASIYKRRNAEKKRLEKIEKDNLCYLFVSPYINIISINGYIPIPLEKKDCLNFKAIPKNSRGYLFEYTNIVNLNFQYIENHVIKKNVTTDKIEAIYNVKPGRVYYIYGDDKNEENIMFKFEDITKESK
ncbi:hypothetical protein [Miniphocaeibacter massiliensis]|uniref:hypothetical protein n=1 Tax=Miniphocaeibacter massiliensis TaxID=2041841 RepID=UPI000C1C65C2|nr:hypothetical protein [Miniphocaeibacter massiliensis]